MISRKEERSEPFCWVVSSFNLRCNGIFTSQPGEEEAANLLFLTSDGLYGSRIARFFLVDVFHPLVKSLLHWFPALIYAILIFSLSQQSDPPGADLAPDHLLHFIEYGLFSLTVAWGLTRGARLPLSGRLASLAFLISVIYGAVDEFHQLFIPGRNASIYDFLADSLGAFAFLFSVHLLMSSVRRQPL